MYDVDPSWKLATDAIDAIRDRVGTTVVDAETGQRWDHGQAVCREMFGADWNDDPRFIELCNAQVCPAEYFAAVGRVANGESAWVDYERSH